MTVAELIAALRRLDPTLPVVVVDDGEYRKVYGVDQATIRYDYEHREMVAAVIG